MPHIKAKYLEPQQGTGYHAAFNGIAAEALAANDLVIATGHSGDRVKWSKADANVAGLRAGAMGIADHAAANGASVRIVSHKLITGVDTDASSGVGYPVYLSDTAGSWTVTAPTEDVVVGSVLADDATTGAILLAPAHCASAVTTQAQTP